MSPNDERPEELERWKWGDCISYAVALQRLYGWTIRLYTASYEEDGEEAFAVLHAVALDQDWNAHDVDGIVNTDSLKTDLLYANSHLQFTSDIDSTHFKPGQESAMWKWLRKSGIPYKRDEKTISEAIHLASGKTTGSNPPVQPDLRQLTSDVDRAVNAMRDKARAFKQNYPYYQYCGDVAGDLLELLTEMGWENAYTPHGWTPGHIFVVIGDIENPQPTDIIVDAWTMTGELEPKIFTAESVSSDPDYWYDARTSVIEGTERPRYSNPPGDKTDNLGQPVKGLVLKDGNIFAWKTDGGHPQHEEFLGKSKDGKRLANDTLFEFTVMRDKDRFAVGIYSQGYPTLSSLNDFLKRLEPFVSAYANVHLNYSPFSYDGDLKELINIMSKAARKEPPDEEKRIALLRKLYDQYAIENARRRMSSNTPIREKSENPPPAHFWGRAGAGVLFRCTADDTYLLVLRSAQVQQPGTLGIPGGSCSGEDFFTGKQGKQIGEAQAWVCAMRETKEELSWWPKQKQVASVIVYERENFQYQTFVVEIPASEKEDADRSIRLNWENDEFIWMSLAEMVEAREQLHFGLQYVLEQLGV